MTTIITPNPTPREGEKGERGEGRGGEGRQKGETYTEAKR